MKLVILCLFAVCCYAIANTTPTKELNKADQRRKLEETLRELYEVKETHEHKDMMLNTPPENIEDCCCVSALQCFRANLQVHFNMTERKPRKLHRSLKSQYTVQGLDFCNSGNNSTTCQDCDLHPKVNAQEFFRRLEALIQRGISKLTMG